MLLQVNKVAQTTDKPSHQRHGDRCRDSASHCCYRQGALGITLETEPMKVQRSARRGLELIDRTDGHDSPPLLRTQGRLHFDGDCAIPEVMALKCGKRPSR